MDIFFGIVFGFICGMWFMAWMTMELAKTCDFINYKWIKRMVSPPPLKYWQHDETGRVCEGVIQPGERWYQILKKDYEAILESWKLSDETP